MLCPTGYSDKIILHSLHQNWLLIILFDILVVAYDIIIRIVILPSYPLLE